MADPDILTPDEFYALLKELDDDRVRTMVVLAGCLGLSQSEFTGLKWADFNWAEATLTVQRGIVHCHVGDTKTKERRKPVALAEELVTVLNDWRSKTPYPADSDWLFASEMKDGKEPYWPDNLLKRFVKRAAVRAKITKRVGWHMLRHYAECRNMPNPLVVARSHAHLRVVRFGIVRKNRGIILGT